MNKEAKKPHSIPRIRRKWIINPRTRVKPNAKKYNRSQQKGKWKNDVTLQS